MHAYGSQFLPSKEEKNKSHGKVKKKKKSNYVTTISYCDKNKLAVGMLKI